MAKDYHQGDTIHIHATTVINATGPWVDDVRSKDVFSNSKRLRLTKGVHIVIDRSVFPLRQAIYFDAPDGRMIFAIPRGEKAYIGTTDTFFDSDKTTPLATEKDIDYLLDTVHVMFPKITVNRRDVESTWAGVRPLIYEDGKDPSEISRKDEIWDADSGLITIAGGKLTGYRKMAETVVDVVVKRHPSHDLGPCVTEHLPLSGGDFGGIDKYKAFIASKTREAAWYGLSEEEGNRLAAFYGTNVDTVFTYAHALQSDDFNLPCVLKAEIFYAVHHEMALTPSDFLIRRKGDLYFDIAQVERIKEAVTAYMAKLLSYNEDEKTYHLQELENHITEAKGREDASVMELTLEMTDDFSVHAFILLPKANPLGHIHLLHGMAEHIGRYTEFAQFLAEKGYIVSGHDHRGHGKTAEINGIKGHFADEGGFDRVVQDAMKSLRTLRRKYPSPDFSYSAIVWDRLSREDMSNCMGRKWILPYFPVQVQTQVSCVLQGK